MTWQQYLDGRGGALYVDARIDGLAPPSAPDPADGDGRYRLCIQAPDYATDAVHWLPVLVDWPELLGETFDVFGGLPAAMGRATVQVLDHRDVLTRAHQPASRPVTLLAEDLDASETSIDVVDGSVFTAPCLMYVGSECMRVTAVATNVLTVTRGYANTDATTHVTNDRCFAALRSLLGRRLEIRLGPAVVDDEQVVGEYVIDEVRWADSANVWIIGGRSQLKYLDRAVPRVANQAKIVKYDAPSRALVVEPASAESGASPQTWAQWSVGTPATRAWGYVNGELLALNPSYRTVVELVNRDPANTNDLTGYLTRALVAGHDFNHIFSPSPPTAIPNINWGPSQHWAYILLSILTSPADDAFAPGANPDNNYGNWSSLPAGYGLGLPASLLDVGSFVSVFHRTIEARLPNFVLTTGADDRPRLSGRQLLDTEFLKPMNATIVPITPFAGGRPRLTLVLPRAPLIDEVVTTTINVDSVLEIPDAGYAVELQTKSVTWTLGPDRAPITFSSADYGDLWGQRDYYVDDSRAAEVEVPGGDASLRSVYGARAAAMLWRLHRPHVRLPLRVDAAAAWAAVPGGYVRVVLPELPDGRGARGWAAPGALATVLGRELEVVDGALTGSLQLLVYDPDERMGRVAPAASVISFAGNVFTVEPNRYSAEEGTDFVPELLESHDLLAFAVGDVLRLVNRAGTSLTGTLQTVVSIDAINDEIELDGDFGGIAVDGDVLSWVGYDDAGTDQRTHAAFMAARATGVVGTDGEPFVYAEP